MSISTTLSTSRPISITLPEAVEVLRSVRGAQPVSIIALTIPEQKVNTAFGGAKVRKLVRVNGLTGCRYANALAKVSGEEANPDRAWGSREISALVEKPTPKGTAYYLPIQLRHVSRPLFLVPKEDGKLAAVAASLVQPLLRQRPEQAVAYRDYSLANVLGLSIGGRRYRIRH